MDRLVIKFQEGKWKKIFVLKPIGEAASEPIEKLSERISDLVTEIPDSHSKRRVSEEKINRVMRERYPEKKKKWDEMLEKAAKYEAELKEYRSLLSHAKQQGTSNLGIEVPVRPDVYPVSPSMEPVLPDPLPEDTFDETSLVDCINEIQSLDFEAYGFLLVDSASSGELLTITSEDDDVSQPNDN